jgi:hypothetical protein
VPNKGNLVSEAADRAVQRFDQSALRFAQQAAADLTANRHDDSMAHAGIALEHMAKAFLVRQHPVLVVAAPGGRLDLAGMRWALKNEPRPAGESRTIDAKEAIRRCCALLSGLDEKMLRPVLEARNGVIHMAQTDVEANRVIAAVAQAAEVILPEIGSDARRLWGHFYDAVMGRLDKQRDEVAHRVADRRAKAREDWEVTFKRLGVDGVNALRGLADGQTYRDNEVSTECPSCGSPAVASGRLGFEEVPDYDQDGVSGVTPVPYIEISELRCPACGFWLDGVEELVAAGVSIDWREVDVDPRDYYGDY